MASRGGPAALPAPGAGGGPSSLLLLAASAAASPQLLLRPSERMKLYDISEECLCLVFFFCFKRGSLTPALIELLRDVASCRAHGTLAELLAGFDAGAGIPVIGTLPCRPI